ncbi:MAG: XdhC family protein [Bacteroidia bacterium]
MTPQSPDLLNLEGIDRHTAVVIMTHHYARDLQYLLALQSLDRPAYIGVIGSSKRRDRLLDEYMEYAASADQSFLDLVYAPAGLNIGAITPEEIAISIIAEILSVVRKTKPGQLRLLEGPIHANG